MITTEHGMATRAATLEMPLGWSAEKQMQLRRMRVLPLLARRCSRIPKAILFLAIAAVVFSPCASYGAQRQQAERTFEKTLALDAGRPLRVEHSQGDITIRTSTKPQAIIKASIRVSAPSGAEAEQFARNIEVAVEPAASMLSIRTRYPKQNRSLPDRRNISYSVDYDITMPETSPLQIRNSFGSVSVSGLKAGADIDNNHGLLKFTDGRGIQRLKTRSAELR